MSTDLATSPLLATGAKRSDLNTADDSLEAGIRARAANSPNDEADTCCAAHVNAAIAAVKAKAKASPKTKIPPGAARPRADGPQRPRLLGRGVDERV